MDPLELHAMMRDGGSWYELAARFWAVLVIFTILALATLFLMIMSAREDSLTGRLLRWFVSRLGTPRADHLFLRVDLTKVGEESAKPVQAYLSSIGSHAMFIYSKYDFTVGQILEISPPGVTVIVHESRCISLQPPWFAIDAEPFFRDDRTRKIYRKFIGEISQVA